MQTPYKFSFPPFPSLLPIQLTLPVLLSLLSCCFNTGWGGKRRKKIRTDQKQKENSKANVSYYSTGSFRAFDVSSLTQSCFFHSLFLHTNKMLHVLYIAHPQLLFKAHLSQLTVLCNIFQTSTHTS